MESQALMTERRFWPLFWTQFLGAFNDNVFKNALVIMITYKGAEVWGLTPEQMVALCTGLLILPFVLFSATAGQLADKFSKSRIARVVKLAEIGVMSLAAYGFYIDSVPFLVGVLFFMGLQSAFFGPVKFGLLPELLRENELTRGNALVSMGTFVSILLGILIGGMLVSFEGIGGIAVSIAVITFAIIGYIASRCIPHQEAAAPETKIALDPVMPNIRIFGFAMKTRSVFLAILAVSWFWFFAAACLSVFPVYCRDILQGNEAVSTFFLALFSIGVGTGSILCGRLSKRGVELGLVPVGAIGMSIFAIDLFFAGNIAPVEVERTLPDFLTTLSAWRVIVDLAMMSFFGGLFVVPLQTLIQQRADAKHRARVIAASALLNSFFVVVSSLALMGLYALDFTAPQVFLMLGIANITVTVYIFTVIPEFFYRFLAWILANTIYRLKVIDDTNLPEQGPALLVCNHVSFIDWLIVAGSVQRPVRFVMHYSFMNWPLMGWFFKSAGVIPIASAKDSPDTMEAAFNEIGKALDEGFIVCIFPEGCLTRDGEMNIFRPGVERILKRNPVPVVPMALCGLWGSFFSRKDKGRALTRPFSRVWSRVQLRVGAPLPATSASAQRLQGHVANLRGEWL